MYVNYATPMNLWSGIRPNVAATSAVNASKAKSSTQIIGVLEHTAQSTHMTNVQNVIQELTVILEKPSAETVEKRLEPHKPI